jgi:hypothetical protein
MVPATTAYGRDISETSLHWCAPKPSLPEKPPSLFGERVTLKHDLVSLLCLGLDASYPLYILVTFCTFP